MANNKRSYVAPKNTERCTAWAHSAVKGEGARCMRRRTNGTLCQQHYRLSLPLVVRLSADMFVTAPAGVVCSQCSGILPEGTINSLCDICADAQPEQVH